MNSVTIQFDKWPHPNLFPNKAGNTLHWAQRSGLRKVAKEEAYWLAIEQAFNNIEVVPVGESDTLIQPTIPIPFKKATILIRVTAKDRRKRDLDGFLSAAKSWIDGIVEAGIIEDDNYFCVGEITIIFNSNIRENTVSITITEN